MNIQTIVEIVKCDPSMSDCRIKEEKENGQEQREARKVLGD